MRLIDADEIEWVDISATEDVELATFPMFVNEQPTVDAVPVVHGWWENHPHQFGFVRCSVCHDCNIWGEWADGKKWQFCPHCGARMDGD